MKINSMTSTGWNGDLPEVEGGGGEYEGTAQKQEAHQPHRLPDQVQRLAPSGRDFRGADTLARRCTTAEDALHREPRAAKKMAIMSAH